MKNANAAVAAIRSVFFVILLIKASVGFGQVAGCTDPYANNYNPHATQNDGSCTYNVTSYTPPIKVDPISDTLIESSGLQWAANSLWSFNDGGGAAAIYRIDTLSKNILQTVKLENATNIDWEDIAYDGAYFYVGDFGNNANGARTDLKIYKFPASAIPDYNTNAIVTIPASQIEIINFSYADQNPIVAAPVDSTRFDCEAMVVDNGKIHLFTKNWIDLTTTHYIINSIAAGTYSLQPAETLATDYLVTAADKSPGQDTIILLGYQNSGIGYHFMHLLYGYSGGNFFNGNKRQINLPDATQMGQGEGITFRNSTYGYISNEKFQRSIGPITLTVNQKLRTFNLNNIPSSSVLAASDLKRLTAINNNGNDVINWNFETTVHKLTLQQSTNATAFTALQTYNTSIEGTYNNKPNSSTRYYRLSWQTSGSSTEYSPVISVKSNLVNSISNCTLKSNGTLFFEVNGENTIPCSFRLISADGRLMGRSKTNQFAPGFHSINLIGTKNLTGSFFLNIQTNDRKSSVVVLAER